MTCLVIPHPEHVPLFRTKPGVRLSVPVTICTRLMWRRPSMRAMHSSQCHRLACVRRKAITL